MEENLDTTANQRIQLIVSEKAKKGLKTATLWGIISSCLGFVLALFFLFQGARLYMTIAELEEQMASSPIFAQSGSSGMGGMFTTMKISAFIIILLGLTTIAIGIFIVRFAVSTSKAVKSTDGYALEKAITFMRTGFVFTAINYLVMIIGIGYYLYLYESAQGRF